MINKYSSPLLLLALALILVTSAVLKRQEKEVKHLVAFKFKPEVNPFQIEEINQEFKSLQKKIPGIMSVEIGSNFSDEDVSNEYTHTYMLTFASRSDKAAFIPHPEMQKLKSFLQNLDVVEKHLVLAYTPL